MTISYNWLSTYLPIKLAPERLSVILTSIGLEVESMEPFEEVKGGLKGLLIGEVLQAEQHPNADKLKLTSVNVGGDAPLQIVCGAPNVAAGQKVVVATVGTTIYPTKGEPLTMKVAKIRGSESYGMICAEDEMGLGDSHAGILVLADDAPVGTPAADYFKPYSDIIYEIGLTPNRADAMSHWGVARDVCAYLSHHDGAPVTPQLPEANFQVDHKNLNIQVVVQNEKDCPRYSGVCLSNLTVGQSPKWLQERLKSIGVRPINNIVDVTNFIQHETGQPLHAFDYDKIKGGKVIVKNQPAGTPFLTLDEKSRTLDAEDLMICNESESMCIAGVFGGLNSGVTEDTVNIFLESAFFEPVTIRKTSFRHGLRTDAATRFEKGVDISNTVSVLKRAALLIKDVAGGEIASELVDIYPAPQPRKTITLSFSYLKKLSGKIYPPAKVQSILKNLGFGVVEATQEAISLTVPYHKRDVAYPADIVEEVLRIDGLDAIEIPAAITITPSIEVSYKEAVLKEKVASALVGLGFTEILTNSITNSNYFSEAQLSSTVRLLNNLSSELDVLRPAMLPTAMEVISFNINRKSKDLKFFEFGKTYSTSSAGSYQEQNHLCLYLTGDQVQGNWKGKTVPADLFFLKGVTGALLKLMGLSGTSEVAEAGGYLDQKFTDATNGGLLLEAGRVSAAEAARFDIKQPLFYAAFNWDLVVKEAGQGRIRFREVPRFPFVERDLAMVVSRTTRYGDLHRIISRLNLPGLKEVRLFDVFESEKLGAGKKSLAVNFTFLDEQKTLTDKEIDTWMGKIITTLEREAGVEIRK
ncbi:MAG TPA: phenylalanine--tRNA ligase subunit beta [Flavisolibacter sp.]